MSCVQSGDPLSTAQTLGQAYDPQRGVIVSITPGVVLDTQTQSPTTMRASVPNPQLDLSTTQSAQGPFSLTLQNIARGSTVRVISNAEQGRGSVLAGLDQASASACIKEQPVVMTCADEQGRCAPAAVTFTAPTEATLTLELEPCRQLILRVEPPERLRETLSFGVVGQSEDTGQLRAALSQAQVQDLDMVIVLAGARDKQANYIDLLAQVTSGLSVPVVVLTGALEEEQSALFAEAFGQTNFRWTLGQVQFVNFFSSSSGVGTRGLNLLEVLLTAAAREEQRNRPEGADARQWPLFAVSSTPPLPTSSFVEDGYDSRLEAARVLSLLARFGVDTLFASGEHDVEVDAAPNVTTTQLAQPGFSQGGKLVVVEVSSEPQPGSRPLGTRYILTRTLDAP